MSEKTTKWRYGQSNRLPDGTVVLPTGAVPVGSTDHMGSVWVQWVAPIVDGGDGSDADDDA